MGLTPVYSSAALFIRPENLSLQQSTINLHACLSLGAEPSCSRPPWVKLNRFSPTLPQSGALINVWGTSVMGQTNKKAPKRLHWVMRNPRGTPQYRHLGACLSCITTMGRILTENQKGCQEPRSKGTQVHEHPVRQWGLILPLGARWEGIPQGTGKPAGSVVIGVWGFNHAFTCVYSFSKYSLRMYALGKAKNRFIRAYNRFSPLYSTYSGLSTSYPYL